MPIILRTQVIFTLLLSLLIGVPGIAAAQASPTALSDLINLAGSQRMLSQRIVKNYAQLLLDFSPGKSHREMTDAIALYEQQLNELDTLFSQDEVISTSLKDAHAAWAEFKELVNLPLQRDFIKELLKLDDKVLAASHAIVLDLTAKSASKAINMVNIAGRQRMLSQRIAKFYMISALGFHDENIVNGLDTAAREFRAGLEEMTNAESTTQKILWELKAARREWSVFDLAFNLRRGEYAPSMIASYSEKMLRRMDKITELYAAMPAQ